MAMVEMAMVEGVRFIVQGGFMNVAVAATTGLACADADGQIGSRIGEVGLSEVG